MAVWPASEKFKACHPACKMEGWDNLRVPSGKVVTSLVSANKGLGRDLLPWGHMFCSQCPRQARL